MPVNNESALLTEDKDMFFVNLPGGDWSLIVECIDHRLYHMDQENHFFQEEPGSKYHELIEIRDYILGLTYPQNRV
jgi:hypothetical protein